MSNQGAMISQEGKKGNPWENKTINHIATSTFEKCYIFTHASLKSLTSTINLCVKHKIVTSLSGGHIGIMQRQGLLLPFIHHSAMEIFHSFHYSPPILTFLSLVME